MKSRLIFICFAGLGLSLATSPLINAQVQLLLLKRNKVFLRLNPGDELIYKLKGSKEIQRGYVNNLSDTAVDAGNKIIPFAAIDKVYFENRSKSAAFKIMGFGVLLFFADQVNDSNKGIDSNIAVASAAIVAVSLPFALLENESKRLNHRYRLLVVRKGSSLYREMGKPMY